MPAAAHRLLVAIACGGTGGHLFPGLAVAEELVKRGCDVMLLVSPKEVDQQAVKTITDMQVITLPAVGLSGRHLARFGIGFGKSFLRARKQFRLRPPQAVLAMGGFTSAPPVLAGKACGAATFLHESNTIPGRANRWLARFIDQAFVGFPSASPRLPKVEVVVTGTPVRAQFQPADPAAARVALGLEPQRPVLLVMGGSQGAKAINDLLFRALPRLAGSTPELQYLHLTGPQDVERVRESYAAQPCRAVVHAFLTEMELAMAAATLGISRAGASSLAEIAAMRLPCLLVPYPIAADNHQFYNARALAEAGAALLLEQAGATGEKLATHVLGLLLDEAAQSTMKEALARWHHPDAATLIAEKILARAQPTSQSQLNEAQSHASDDSTLRHSQSSSVSCDLKSQP